MATRENINLYHGDCMEAMAKMLDEDYYKAGKERFDNYAKQLQFDVG